VGWERGIGKRREAMRRGKSGTGKGGGSKVFLLAM